MANTREVMTDRFVVFSGIGLRQTAQGTPTPNVDLDVRDKCTITRELVVERRIYADCRDEDNERSKIVQRYARWTFNYAEINPQIIARMTSYLQGAAAAPSGTPANEVQTLTPGVVPYTISATIEGRTVTTKELAAAANAAAIQAALTASRMMFIQPGDVVVTGASSPFTLTFPETGRLGRANLPLFVATGGAAAITASANGDQNFFAITRSPTRVLPFFSIAMGWESDADRVEKYIDLTMESAAPTLSRDGDVGFQFTAIGPWDRDSIEEAFDIPDCVSIDPLSTTDCRVQIDSVWQTEDIVSLTAPVNNSIPLDRLSAFPFEGIEIQNQQRGRKPVYGPLAISVFGSEVDSLHTLAYDERTEAEVPVLIHFGMPGNRTTWSFPETKIVFQTNPLGEAGEARYSTIQIEGLPMKEGINPPFESEAYLDQSVAFLDTP